MISEDDVYKIGVLAKTHGVGGELGFTFTDDVFDRVEADYLICRMDGILVPFFLEDYRFRSNSMALVKFEGIDTEAQARRMVGVEVFFPKALAEEGGDAAYSWEYFVGFTIVEKEAGEIGRVEAVDDSTMNVLFEVGTPSGQDLFIPVAEEWIDDIDHSARKIYMHLPEGLLDLHEH